MTEFKRGDVVELKDEENLGVFVEYEDLGDKGVVSALVLWKGRAKPMIAAPDFLIKIEPMSHIQRLLMLNFDVENRTKQDSIDIKIASVAREIKMVMEMEKNPGKYVSKYVNNDYIDWREPKAKETHLMIPACVEGEVNKNLDSYKFIPSAFREPVYNCYVDWGDKHVSLEPADPIGRKDHMKDSPITINTMFEAGINLDYSVSMDSRPNTYTIEGKNVPARDVMDLFDELQELKKDIKEYIQRMGFAKVVTATKHIDGQMAFISVEEMRKVIPELREKDWAAWMRMYVAFEAGAMEVHLAGKPPQVKPLLDKEIPGFYNIDIKEGWIARMESTTVIGDETDKKPELERGDIVKYLYSKCLLGVFVRHKEPACLGDVDCEILWSKGNKTQLFNIGAIKKLDISVVTEEEAIKIMELEKERKIVAEMDNTDKKPEFEVGDRVMHKDKGPGEVINMFISSDGVNYDVKLDSNYHGMGVDGSWRTRGSWLTLIENELRFEKGDIVKHTEIKDMYGVFCTYEDEEVHVHFANGPENWRGHRHGVFFSKLKLASKDDLEKISFGLIGQLGLIVDSYGFEAKKRSCLNRWNNTGIEDKSKKSEMQKYDNFMVAGNNEPYECSVCKCSVEGCSVCTQEIISQRVVQVRYKQKPDDYIEMVTKMTRINGVWIPETTYTAKFKLDDGTIIETTKPKGEGWKQNACPTPYKHFVTEARFGGLIRMANPFGQQHFIWIVHPEGLAWLHDMARVLVDNKAALLSVSYLEYTPPSIEVVEPPDPYGVDSEELAKSWPKGRRPGDKYVK